VASAYAEEAKPRSRAWGCFDCFCLECLVGVHHKVWECLAELNWVRGKNLRVEQRWAEGRLEKLPGLMAEVIAHKTGCDSHHHASRGVSRSRSNSYDTNRCNVPGRPCRPRAGRQPRVPGDNVTGISLQSAIGTAANGYNYFAKRCRVCRRSLCWKLR
jgi:hypothetical protein